MSVYETNLDPAQSPTLAISGQLSQKLNLGSDGRVPGWVNVDLYNDCDVQADIRQLPFADNTFKRVLASHVLEHIPLEEVPMALQEIKRVCRPGGRILIRLPNSYQENENAARVSREGWSGRPGYLHYWECTADLLRQLGQQVGLDFQEVEDQPGWPPASWPYLQIIMLATNSESSARRSAT